MIQKILNNDYNKPFFYIQVIAQGIGTLTKLGNKLSDDKILMMRLVGVGKDNLKDTSHQVKCRCLQLISQLYPIQPESDRNADMITEAEAIIKLLGDYSNAEVIYTVNFFFNVVIKIHLFLIATYKCIIWALAKAKGTCGKTHLMTSH